jgi:hypothetical protein
MTKQMEIDQQNIPLSDHDQSQALVFSPRGFPYDVNGCDLCHLPCSRASRYYYDEGQMICARSWRRLQTAPDKPIVITLRTKMNYQERETGPQIPLDNNCEECGCVNHRAVTWNQWHFKEHNGRIYRVCVKCNAREGSQNDFYRS